MTAAVTGSREKPLEGLHPLGATSGGITTSAIGEV